ncbi:MAG: hypothetical protein ABJK28_18645 [Algibacter sp.]
MRLHLDPDFVFSVHCTVIGFLLPLVALVILDLIDEDGDKLLFVVFDFVGLHTEQGAKPKALALFIVVSFFEYLRYRHVFL